MLNYEGVNGLEQMKWFPSKEGTSMMVTYDVTIPFIRMIAGRWIIRKVLCVTLPEVIIGR